MGKCVKCDKLLPPDLMVDVDKPDEKGLAPGRCIFCEQGITEFGGNTKEEHIKDYEIFLKRLKNAAGHLDKKKSLILNT